MRESQPCSLLDEEGGYDWNNDMDLANYTNLLPQFDPFCLNLITLPINIANTH